MRIWKVDDGDTHYVFALTREDALRMVGECAGWTGADYWVDPVAEELTQDQADVVVVIDEDEDKETTIGAMFRADPVAGYVAGSVW